MDAFQSRLFIKVYLNYNKDNKMKNLVIRKTLQNKLWIAVLASLIGLSACNNEREDTTNANTGSTTADSSEMAPVPSTQDNEASMNTSMDNTGGDENQAHYVGTDSAQDEGRGVGAVTTNEEDSILDHTSAEGVQ